MVQSIKGSFQPKCFAGIGDGASIVAAKTKLIPSRQQFFLARKTKTETCEFDLLFCLLGGLRGKEQVSLFGFMAKTFENGYCMQPTKQTFFFNDSQRFLESNWKTKGGGVGTEKRKTLPPPPPSTTSFLTRRPLPWNQFLTRPNSLSIWTSKMAGEHSIVRTPKYTTVNPV